MSRLDDKVFEAYRSTFARQASPTLDELLKPKVRYWNQLIERHFPKDKSAIGVDLGCGTGLLVHVAHQNGYREFSGVDVSPEEIDLGHRLGIKSIRLSPLSAELERLPQGSQDLIAAIDVLEHFSKDDAFALAEKARSVLKPGGRFLIQVPNGAGIFGRTTFFSDVTHKTLFTPESLQQLLRAAGFTKIEAHGTAPIPKGLASFLRLLAWRVLRILYLATRLTDPGAGGSSIVSATFVAVATK